MDAEKLQFWEEGNELDNDVVRINVKRSTPLDKETSNISKKKMSNESSDGCGHLRGCGYSQRFSLPVIAINCIYGRATIIRMRH